MGVIRSMLGRTISALVLLLLVLGGAARAEPSEAERAARWSDLRHAIFGNRFVEDAGDLVAIGAPARAEDAAIVPVAIRVVRLARSRGSWALSSDRRQPVTACGTFRARAGRRRAADRYPSPRRRGTPTCMRSQRPPMAGSTPPRDSSRLRAAARPRPQRSGARARAARQDEAHDWRASEPRFTGRCQAPDQSSQQLRSATRPADAVFYPGGFHADPQGHL